LQTANFVSTLKKPKNSIDDRITMLLSLQNLQQIITFLKKLKQNMGA
jgi:hypothetical protein